MIWQRSTKLQLSEMGIRLYRNAERRVEAAQAVETIKELANALFNCLTDTILTRSKY
jgi:hypothetical protein